MDVPLSISSLEWTLNAQQAIIDELQTTEDITTRSHSLDYLITENEIGTAARKLKNNKSSFSDEIKNEMIKSSLNELMPVSLKHGLRLRNYAPNGGVWWPYYTNF